MTTEEAFDLYHQAVFSFVYRLTRRADLAEDITQDCFLAYIGAPERFDMARGASLKTYLIATARNMAFNWIRDHRCEWQAYKLEATTPPESGMTSEICAAVQSAIAGLPPLQQEALILFEYEGFMLDEIAVMAGVDAGTIKSRLHRARERLRRVLARFKNTGELHGRT
jgi:RNA polymerase sigma-70 factor (ECF subfamily)